MGTTSAIPAGKTTRLTARRPNRGMAAGLVVRYLLPVALLPLCILIIDTCFANMV